MKRSFRTFLTLLLLIAGTAMSWADFTDFKLVLAKGYEGCLVTDEEFATQYTTVEFGYVVNSNGTVTRVAKDDPTSMGTIKGKSHSEHGITNFEMTVKVDGGVKIGMGTCNWGGDVKINGTTAFTTNAAGKCWHNDQVNNIAYGHYTGEAGTITISGGSYTAYLSVEAETVKTNVVSFGLGSVECESLQLPESKDVIDGESMTIPANYTLYKEGYTLTGWTDGTNTYNTGSEFTPTESVQLTPVFTQNTKSLADRTESVTIKWNFRKDQGAPSVSYQNKDGLIYVAQTTVDGETIDVKMDLSTNPGKFHNASNSDWAQVNAGTKFTIPSCKGATVSLETFDAVVTTTVDGVAAEGNTNTTYSTEIASKAETIDIVANDGRYYRYIQVVLPVVDSPAPTLKEKLIYGTQFSDWSTAAAADSYTTDVTTSDSQKITFTLHQTKVDPTSFDESRFKEPSTKGYLIAEKNKQGTITTTAFKNITKLTYVHGATGGSRGWGLKVKGDGDEDWVTVYSTFASPAQGQKVELDINRSNVQLQFYNLADAQNAYLMSLEIKGMVEVLGETYTVGVAAAPAEGGSATIYPIADDYTEGDEVTLTATENFGYDFVNWTNAAGEEVSTEAKYKATVTANETYTANFVQVNTYAVNVALEGGANDYMISYNPAPTVVEGKNMYEAGTKVAITAAENPVLTFNNWDNGETSKSLEVTMDDNVNLTATYSAIDFIAGWDFYQTGGRTRVADFIGNTDNEAATMDMIDASGASKGFYLRPYNNSYEGKTCALNWNALAEKYYFQTSINTTDFSNIQVQSQMMYNYNAWTVQKLEASLNGTEWETITSQDLGGTKNWQAVNGTLPAKYEHQPKVYLRWIPDYTSEVKGTASANDGTCLTNVYIIADKQLVDDGTAPVLVSTVPAEGANTASANGKIVLTFDEKVKVADGTKATLGDMQLTPAVSGKTVTFEYKQLKYATAYTFTLPANSIADLTDNAIAEAITINFQTKQKPTIEKGLYDVIVTNGEEMKAAIAQANSRADKSKRFRIFVMPGSHKIPVYDTKVTVEVELANGTKEPRTYDEPRTYITGDNISIIGADYETTTITNSTPTETFTGRFGDANISEGIGNNDVFQISAKNTYLQGVTVKTGFGDARGRDIAIQDKGDKTIIKDARLWGYQDTYTNNANGRFYFEGGVVRGRTDYLCGKGDIWFEGVTLQQCGQGGYPIVPSQPRKYGWIFNGCTLTPETSDVSCTLGRPWGSGTPIALLINTVMEVVPGAEGWSEMSGGWPARFAEYNSTTKAGTVIDLSQRKKTFGGKENCNNPVLTAEEAAQYSIAKVMGDGDDWDPTALTEQASAPENVIVTETTLSWDDSNYVFCWAVIKDGNIVDFTTTPSYAIDDASATWSVRAANEMGGLGEATVAQVATAITDIMQKPAFNGAMYNIAGQRVNANAKGIVIMNGKKMMK